MQAKTDVGGVVRREVREAFEGWIAGHRPGLVIAAVCALAALLFAGPAAATTVNLTKYNGIYPNGSFDGHDAVGTSSPTFSGNKLAGIDVDQSTGNPSSGSVYLAYGGTPSGIYKFDSAGVSQPFSVAPGTNTFIPQSGMRGGEREAIAVDNSGGANQGRFYLVIEYGAINAYLPSGALATSFTPATYHPCGAAVGPTGNLWVEFWQGGIQEFTPAGVATGKSIDTWQNYFCRFAMDSEGNFYFTAESKVRKVSPTGQNLGVIENGSPGFEAPIAIDRSNNDVYVDEGNKINHYNSAGDLIETFGEAEPSHSYPGLTNSDGIAVNMHTHVVYASNNGSPNRIDTFAPAGPETIPTVTTTAPEDVTPTSATLRGVVNGDGVDTTDCHFEWGTSTHYETSVPCAEGNVFTGSSGDNNVTAAISGLTKGTLYHFRLTAKNANGIPSGGNDRTFRASDKPIVSEESVTHVNTDGAQLNAEVDPNSGDTSYHIEWGTSTNYENSVPVPDAQLASHTTAQSVSQTLSGLSPGTTYYFQVVAHNDAGTTTGAPRVFATFPLTPAGDPCPNAHVRQQTGAALLLDCRAYELVSAANTGGHDVASDLTPGQAPLTSYPSATDRVLYSLHFGAIPGIAGSPTNFGLDPYVATRGSNGWVTKYVGLPANGMAENGAFGSPLLGSDSSLNSFAFGGNGICEPCFADGSTNIPLRLPDGSLIQGMAGDEHPTEVAPVGEVRVPLSSDGSHFIFGSDKKFEPAASSGTRWIYDRNLNTNETQLVSTLPTGQPITGTVAELDVSNSGDRILIGKVVGEDSAGNRYYDLYMHIGSSPNSVKVVETGSGVIFNGMASDGSKVFFTTPDKLAGDGDNSADLFRADVGTTSPAPVYRLSTGKEGAGNTDSCEPVTNWNVVSGGPDCSTVAFAGGAGIATGNGTAYFVSPEKLDGAANGIAGQPNLYVVKPGTPPPPPHFVATIDSSLVKPGPRPPFHPLANSSFASGFSNAAGLAVDESDGSVYVLDINTNTVSKYNSSGGLVTSFGDTSPSHDGHLAGNAAPTGPFVEGPGSFGVSLPTQLAVDQSTGDLYVPDLANGVVDKFDSSGNYLSQISLGDFPGGVAVNPANHNVYVYGLFSGTLYIFTPAGTPVEAVSGIPPATGLAVNSSGYIYTADSFFGNEAAIYDPSGNLVKTLGPNGLNVAADSANGDVYVDNGNQINWFDSSGQAIGTVGSGNISNSLGLAFNSSNKHVFATSGGNKVVEFGYAVPPYTPIDNPAVVHAVSQAGVHSFGDFQVTPDGHFAAFASSLSPTGYANRGFSEIYRYDAQSQTLDCASCASSGAPATANTFLSPYGLNLSDDGRVFFTSLEQMVLRDTNEKKDAYEWEDGKIQIISTGASTSDSGLLSVSSDGTNAYFFTRQTLVPEDQNGALVKIYDARAGGGFPFNPSPFPCAASDECHGPGTQEPPPPNINTVTGAGPSPAGGPPPCPKGKVRKGGKCVKKHKRHKRAVHHNRPASRSHG